MRCVAAIALTCIAIALTACAGKRPGPAIDASLESLVPADTLHLAGARLDRIRDNKLYQSVLGQRQLAQLGRFSQQTGVDPNRDIAEFLAASDGKNNLLLVRGKFSVAEIEKKLAERGLDRTTHGEQVLYGDGTSAIAFLGSTVAVAGTDTGVRAAVDRGVSNSRMPERLASLLAGIPASHNLWLITLGGLPPFELPERSNYRSLARALSAIGTATASAELSGGLQLSIVANYTGEAEAKQIHGALRGLLGLARLSAPRDQPELQRVFDAFQIHLAGSTLKVNGDVPSQALETLVRLFDRGGATVQ